MEEALVLLSHYMQNQTLYLDLQLLFFLFHLQLVLHFYFLKLHQLPIAISPDCSSIEVITAQVSPSNPNLALVYPISFIVSLTNLGIST